MFKLKNYSNKSIVLLVLASLLMVYAFLFASTNFSSGANRAFAQADDFPRGALVYAQFRDLPALINLWNESALKERYLQSKNFNEFQNRHLALKLISRIDEFNEALGFKLDVAKIAGVTETKAAIAVYDIGKLEMIFIAPLSDQKIAAAIGFWNQAGFKENLLPDQTVYYSREVKADRGRQKQKILFASVKGRFVIATSEDLLLKTIANLSNKAKKNRLSDDPNFSSLTAKIEPHLATVWVDQSKLNEDWYFKHYWVMQTVKPLKNIRAGIFDFEIPDGKIVEKRAFLSNEKDASEDLTIPTVEAEHLWAIVPAEMPYFKLSVLGNESSAADLINKTLFEKLSSKTESNQSRQSWNSSDTFAYNADDYTDEDDGDYSYFGSDFDKNIDENETDNKTVDTANALNTNSFFKLKQILAAANPSSAVSVADPQVLANPLFAEFRRAAVLNLHSPANFNQPEFEKTVLEIIQNRVGVANARLNLIWETKARNNNSWRELNLPALGWGLAYKMRKNELIVANNSELIETLLKNKNQKSAKMLNEIDEITVINLKQREKTFDAVMKKLAPKKPDIAQAASDESSTSDFFVGNISSLLDTLKGVERIEIKKKHAANFFTEEISFVLQTTK